MSGCARSSAVSVRQEGKTAYLFGDLSQDDLADLVTFAQLYAQSTDGTFADAPPLGGVARKGHSAHSRLRGKLSQMVAQSAGLGLTRARY